jgi:hypothetical protein
MVMPKFNSTYRQDGVSQRRRRRDVGFGPSSNALPWLGVYRNAVEYTGPGIAQSVLQRATGWTAGVRFIAGAIFLSFPQRPDGLWDTTGLQWVPGAFYPGRGAVIRLHDLLN